MDNKYYKFHSSNELDETSTTTSMEGRNYSEDQTLIIKLLEDLLVEETSSNSLLPENGNWRNFLIRDKVKYFSTLAGNICQTKNDFLQIYTTANQKIEEMSQEITACIKQRENYLKSQLLQIKDQKISKWDKQLSACQEALNQLKICSDGRFSITETSLLCSSLNQEITGVMEFVDNNILTLGLDNYSSVLNTLRNLGKIECYTGSSDGDPEAVKLFRPKFVFGGSGSEAGKFCRPWGVCTDVTGRILICDRSNHRIQIFNECGQFLIHFGKEGSGPGEFNRPSGICVDKKCKIIVADKDNHRIQVFTYSGLFLFFFGSQGSKPGQFMYPWDVAVNSNCDIAVSDTKNQRIQLFNEGGRFLKLIDAKRLGFSNPRLGVRRFDSPRGICFRPDGFLLVTDFNNHRVLSINPNFNKASAFGREGTQPGQFFRPQGISCDESGNFAVSDSKNYRVQIFDKNGSIITSFGCRGNEPGQFDCPQGICFHSNQNLIVVDLNNNRVQIF